MLRLLFFTLLFIATIVHFEAQAHTETKDSLWLRWENKELHDSSRLDALNEWIWSGVLFNNPDSAIVLLQLQLDFADRAGNLRYQSEAYNGMGVACFYLGRYDDALTYFKINLDYSTELADSSRIAGTLSNIGNIYLRQGNFRLALKYLEQSLSTDRAIGNSEGVAAGLNNIANVYRNMGNDAQAIEYYHESLKIKERLKDQRGVAGTLTNVGVIQAALNEFEVARNNYQRALEIYRGLDDLRGAGDVLSNLALLEERNQNNQLAREYHEQSLEIRRSIGDSDGMAVSLNNLGAWHKGQGNYEMALSNLEESLKLRESLNDENGMASTLSQMARLFIEINRRNDALTAAKRALVLAENTKSPTEISKAAQVLARLYRELDLPDKAFEMLELEYAMRDSLMSEKNQRAVIRQQYRYDYEKRAMADSLAFATEREIVALQVARQRAELQQQRIALLATAAGIILLVLLAVVIFRSKKRSEELLLNIIPAETARELKATGTSEARLIDQVSVLFTDFKGFTRMSEKVTPKQLVRDLHECFSAFDHICEKYGIEKIKTIGDAYMAACGLPSPDSDHAKKVVLAALEMRDFVAEGKARKIANGLPFFEIRIGIHSGPVVAGIVGVKKFQYDIWGDTVNTASRMESSGEVGKVNISEATYELLKDDQDFAFESRGKIKAKGKGEIEMLFVTARK